MKNLAVLFALLFLSQNSLAADFLCSGTGIFEITGLKISFKPNLKQSTRPAKVPTGEIVVFTLIPATKDTPELFSIDLAQPSEDGVAFMSASGASSGPVTFTSADTSAGSSKLTCSPSTPEISK